MGTKFSIYTIIGIMRLLLAIFILLYMGLSYLRKTKKNWFQHLVIWVILILSIYQGVFNILWNGSVVADCERTSRNLNALIESCMFLIGVLVSYFLFKTVSVIYKFSTEGMLPRETSRKRMLFCIVFVVI